MISLSIISADAKRTKVAEYKLTKAIEEEIYNSERPQRVEDLVERMFNELKSRIEETKDYNSVSTIIWDHSWQDPRIFHSTPPKIKFSWQEYRDAFKIVVELLERAGYEISYHECTQSWHSRDGRVFSVSVNWE